MFPELKPAREGLQMAPSVLSVRSVRSETARFSEDSRESDVLL
jgi:hypothetical protein